MRKRIKTVLVANRGEIALRIMKTLSQMGIKSIAVFSEVDRQAPFVQFADFAVCIGKGPSSESYLNQNKIIEVAKTLKADAIHPGYGFLSENAAFASKVEDNGIIFIGPSSAAIQIMGSKIEAKKAVSKFNVPLVPGTDKPIDNILLAKEKAKEIGYPVLIKASAGGGGKGMRIVENENDFEEQLSLAKSEALSAFGDGSVFIEKYIQSPRHIEFQILADTHGNVVHLFERDCSVQRRHQKVIEEAPSMVLNNKIRDEMGLCAVNVAKSCQYIGAGTVEFIMDSDLNYYFLEMNTRLQVEHPVTEFITGVDLVEKQIEIAQGGQLTLKQEDLKIEGHAIEIRVYAEDPANGFLPDIGTLHDYKIPAGVGIRVDDGYRKGQPIPIYYDPMIAKLIVHGKDRAEAIDKMLWAIREYKIIGVETTLDFCAFAINHQNFRSGNFDTNFVNQHFKPAFLDEKLEEDEKEVALLFSAIFHQRESGKSKPQPQHTPSASKEWINRYN